MKDLYEILAVQKGAGEDEIKRAYRKLAQQYHPDRNKGDKEAEKRFKEINGAYEILSDKQKRSQYDQFGHAGGGPQGSTGGAGFDFESFGGFGGGFADIFETFFGGSRAGSQSAGQARGAHREAEIDLTFEEAAFGAEKKIRMARIGDCPACKATGGAPGSRVITCPQCNGAGEIKRLQNTILGQISTRQMCSRCDGKGRITDTPCVSCSGRGIVRLTDEITAKIPAGIQDGSTIRITGKGDSAGRGASPGDLYLHTKVKPHKLFSREGSDVYSNHHIHVTQAALGDEVNIPTIQGVVRMKIPAGTQNGRVFKLKNLGVAKLRGSGLGDHFVTIHVDIPTRLSKKEKEVYRNLASQAGIHLNEDRGIFG